MFVSINIKVWIYLSVEHSSNFHEGNGSNFPVKSIMGTSILYVSLKGTLHVE